MNAFNNDNRDETEDEEEESDYSEDSFNPEEHKLEDPYPVQIRTLPEFHMLPTIGMSTTSLLDKKKPTCQTILHKNHIIVFGAEIIGRDTNQILLYNLNSQEWKTIIPKGNLEIAENLEYSVSKVSSSKIIMYGAPKNTIIQQDMMMHTLNRSNQSCCQILNLVDLQNMDETGTSVFDLVGAEWELPRIFNSELPYTVHAPVNVVENKLYMYGGKDTGGSINCYLYTVNLTTFKSQSHTTPMTFSPNPPYEYLEPRYKHSGTVYNGKIYYYGGFGLQGKPLFDIWALNVRTLEWKLIRKTILWPHLVVDWFARIEEDRIIFLGGSPQNSDNQHSEIFTYKINTGTWQPNQAQFKFSSGPNTIFEVYKNNIIYGEPLNLNQIPLNQSEPKLSNESNNFNNTDRKLFEDKLYSDISFKIGDTIIQAHKALLITRCQYFKDIFEKSNNEIIEVEDIKANIFNGLLEYLYCGYVQRPSEDVCVELLKLADKYVISGLKEYCEQFLLNKLRVENVVDFTNIADTCEAQALKEGGVRFIADNFETIFKKYDIKQLSNANLLRVFELFKEGKI